MDRRVGLGLVTIITLGCSASPEVTTKRPEEGLHVPPPAPPLPPLEPPPPLSLPERPLPYRQVKTTRARLSGLLGAYAWGHYQVAGLAVSADGRIALSGAPGGLRVWDLIGGREAYWIEEHHDDSPQLALTSDGLRAAWGDQSNGRIHVWDVETAREVRTLVNDAGILAIAFRDDGRLITGDKAGDIETWDLARGQSELTHAIGAEVGGEIIDADLLHGVVALRAPGSTGIVIRSIATGKQLSVPTAEYGQRVAAIDPSGERAVTIDAELQVDVWNVATGERHARLGALAGPATRAVIRGRHVVVSWENQANGAITPMQTIFDLEGEGAAARVERWTGGGCAAMAITPRGHLLTALTAATTGIARGSAGWVSILDLATGASALETSSAITALRPLDATTALAAGSDVLLLDLASGAVRQRLPGDGGRGGINTLAVSPDRRRLAALASYDGYLQLWDLETSKRLDIQSSIRERMLAVAFTPDSKVVFEVGEYGALVSFHVDGGVGSQSDVKVCGERANDRFALAGLLGLSGSSERLQVWDVPRGQATHDLPQELGCRGLAITDDGKLGAVVSTRGVRVIDLTTGQEVRAFDIPAAGCDAPIALSKDGARVAWRVDAKVHVVFDGGEPAVVDLGGDLVTSLAFAEDGTLLIGTERGVVLEVVPGP